jgi:hypothetical protein
MNEKSAFSEAKTRTPKGNARERERIVMDKMEELLSLPDERDFMEALVKFLNLAPGEPHFEEALAVWRSLQKQPFHPQKQRIPRL